MTIDELMQRTPTQVAAYFIPDIIHVTAGCTSRKFRHEQPPIQKQLDEILNRLLERTTHQSKLLAEAKEALELIQKENKRARRQFTNVSNKLISGAVDDILAKLKAATPPAEGDER